MSESRSNHAPEGQSVTLPFQIILPVFRNFFLASSHESDTPVVGISEIMIVIRRGRVHQLEWPGSDAGPVDESQMAAAALG
jgi:hypothetical protein